MIAYPSLASGDSSLLVKLIPFIIFLAIWGLGAVASAINKVKEEARRRQARAQVVRPPGAPRGAVARSMPRVAMLPKPRPGPVRRPSPPPRAVPRTAAARPPLPPLPQIARAAPRRTPAGPSPVRQPSVPRTTLPAAQATPAPVRAQGTRPTPATAAALSKWLRPQTLRAQFILTEILRPPLGMRESHL